MLKIKPSLMGVQIMSEPINTNEYLNSKSKADLVAMVIDQSLALAAMNREGVRLRDALRDFGDHNPLCKRLKPYTCVEMRPDCDCGFNEILEPSDFDRGEKL